MRCYPRSNGVRLGAHVDGNLFTILWTDGPVSAEQLCRPHPPPVASRNPPVASRCGSLVLST